MDKITNSPSDKDRYAYFIEKVLSNKTIWLLQSEDGPFAMVEDNKGQSYLPVWPDKEFAEALAHEDWESYISSKMGLGEFLDWLTELKEDQLLIGVFPGSNMQSLAIDPIELKKVLS